MVDSPPQVISGVEYTVCTPADTDEMVDLLAESFARHDPPAVAVGLTPAEFGAFVDLWAGGAGTEGLSIVARDAETGDMVGALLTDDAAAPMPQGVDDLSDKFAPIFDLLGQIDEEYRTGRSIEPGQYLHLFLLGVEEHSMRRRIGHHLVSVCLANGADRGYTTAVTEATNLVSQHIFRQLGFEPRATRSYGEYRLDGSPTFASIAGHGGPMTMDRQIAPNDH